MRRIAIVTFALLSGFTFAASAADAPQTQAPAPAAAPAVMPYVVNPHEGTDQIVVNNAMAAMGHGGYHALEPLIPALKDVMSHAPASYPVIQRYPRGADVHAADMGEYMKAVDILAAEAKRDGTPGRDSTWTPNTYGLAALLLGGYYDEVHQPNDALPVLERAMKMQPGNWRLTLEYGACLMGLHRQADAIVAFQDTLDHAELISNEGRARLLRNKGVALIDLDRLDEAEIALNESIRLLPNNPQAQNELAYIAQLRAGRPRTDANLTTVQPPDEQQAPQGNSTPKPQKGN